MYLFFRLFTLRTLFLYSAFFLQNSFQHHHDLNSNISFCLAIKITFSGFSMKLVPQKYLTKIKIKIQYSRHLQATALWFQFRTSFWNPDTDNRKAVRSYPKRERTKSGRHKLTDRKCTNTLESLLSIYRNTIAKYTLAKIRRGGKQTLVVIWLILNFVSECDWLYQRMKL